MARTLNSFYGEFPLELVLGKELQHHFSAALTNTLAPFS